MAPLGDIKTALEEAKGDERAALLLLRKRSMALANKRSSHQTSAGLVISYIHGDGTIGVLVELRCETDFVAKTEPFKILARDIAMHIAAMNPACVKPEDIPQKTETYYDEMCLLNQKYIKDTTRTIRELIAEYVAKVGENIEVARFARFEI